MTKSEYMKRAFNLYNIGKIDGETYDCIICNIDAFTDEDETLENMSDDYFD